MLLSFPLALSPHIPSFPLTIMLQAPVQSQPAVTMDERSPSSPTTRLSKYQKLEKVNGSPLPVPFSASASRLS